MTLAAEATHRDHAIVEQVIAELKSGPLAHLPSGGSPPMPHGWSAPRSRTTSPRGRVLAVSSPVAVMPGPAPSLRPQLIDAPARIAHSAHHQVLHLPVTGHGNPGSTSCSAAPCTPPPIPA